MKITLDIPDGYEITGLTLAPIPRFLPMTVTNLTPLSSITPQPPFPSIVPRLLEQFGGPARGEL